MKQDFIIPQVDKVSVPSENEDQRILKAALMRLGPNGENWCQGAYSKDGKFCARGAVHYWGPKAERALDWLDKAAGGGAVSSMALNDEASDFSEVRAMFELAITLAGHPTVKS